MELDVSSDVEFVDHAIPGALILISGTISVMLARGGFSRPADNLLFAFAWRASLMAITGYLIDAATPRKPDAVILHGTAGPAITNLTGFCPRTRRGAGVPGIGADARRRSGSSSARAPPVDGAGGARAIGEANTWIWGANLVMEEAAARTRLPTRS